MSKTDEQKKPVKESDDQVIDRIAAKVAEKLAAKQRPTPFSVCPNCGYVFMSREEEDKNDRCPGCGYVGKTVKLNYDKA